MKDKEIHELLIRKYGKERQLLIAAEEYTELMQQLIKERNGRLNFNGLLEEVADATFITEQLTIIFTIDPSTADVWQVNKNTFRGVSSKLIGYMIEIISKVLEGIWDDRCLDAVTQINGILPKLADYLGKESINNILKSKKENLKKN